MVRYSREKKVVPNSSLNRIVKHIHSFEHEASRFKLSKTMHELGFGSRSYRLPEVIRQETITLEGFMQLRERNVSLLPVLNDKDELVGALSASDLWRLRSTNIVELLNLPLVHFLESNNGHISLLTGTVNMTFSDALKKIDSSGNKHRMILVNESQKPIAVVSLSDIIPLFAV